MYGILIYSFPLILLLFEWGLRSLLGVDAGTYIGPTLAAAGLSFMVGVTRPKEIAVTIPGRPNVIVISTADRNLVGLAWLLLLLALFAWSAAVVVALRSPTDTAYGISIHRLIGTATYLISVILVAIKERV